MGQNIVLTGFMGTGKTTVGKVIAEELQLSFTDIDEEIKKRYSMNIGDIFEAYGEKHFRRVESEVVKELSSVKNHVISTGGGVVLDYNNIAMLQRNGMIFWLSATADTIFKNLKREGVCIEDRPLLKADNLYERITQLLLIREAYYKKSYNCNVCIDKLSVKEAAEECIRFYLTAVKEKCRSII